MIAIGQNTVGTGTIRGSIARSDRTPASAFRICVAGTGQCVLSDRSGRFPALDARPGIRRLEVSAESGESLLTGEVEVRAGLTSEVHLELPEIAAVRSSVTVRASELLTPDEVMTSGVRIQSLEIAKSEGVLQDVSRYIATLPGVVTGSADFRNDIIVRDGSLLENLFVVDNIEIPNINSFANLASAGGTISLLDVQLIEDVTFLTGAYPAPYVNRLSSVMQVAQREGGSRPRRSGSHLGNQHYRYRQHPPGLVRGLQTSRRDKRLRHPLQRPPERHGNQLATHLRRPRCRTARCHALDHARQLRGQGPGARWSVRS